MHSGLFLWYTDNKAAEELKNMNNDIGTCCCLSMVLIILVPLIILSRRKGKQHEKEIALQKERERKKAPQIAFYQHYPAIMTEFERIMRTNKETFRYYIGYDELIDYNELCRIYGNELRLPVRYEGGYLYFDVAPVRKVLQQIEDMFADMDCEIIPDTPLDEDVVKNDIACFANQLSPAIEPRDIWKLFDFSNDTVSMTNRDKYIYATILKQLIEDDKYLVKDGLKTMAKDYYDAWHRFANVICPYFNTEFMHLLDSHRKCEENSLYRYDARYYDNFMDEYNARLKDAQIEIHSCLNGAGGEKIVEDFLENFTSQFHVLKNVTLSDGKTDAECDFIIVAPQGIYVIEVKNYDSAGRGKIVIEEDGRWKHVYADKEEVLKNATAQNDIHIAVIRNILKNKGYDETWQVNVCGLVVIANEQVEIINHDRKQQVIRYTGIVREIQEKETVYNESQMAELHSIIKNEQIPEKRFSFTNHFKTCYLYAQEWKWNYSKSLQNMQKFKNIEKAINDVWESHEDWWNYKNMYAFYHFREGTYFKNDWVWSIPFEIKEIVKEKWRIGYISESNVNMNLTDSDTCEISEDEILSYAAKRKIRCGEAVPEIKRRNEGDKIVEYKEDIYLYHDTFNEE